MIPTELFIASATLAVCFTTSLYLLFFKGSYSLLYYGDSIGHLVIARRIFDSILPGITQLGAVWLPMTHIMLAPFVASDFLFHTGMAGTIVSSISTAVTAVLIFRIVKMQFNSKAAGLLASALYLMNPSVIYMGVVPMMEAPFMMFFMLSVYYLQKWYFLHMSKDSTLKQYRTIMKCTIAISGACLTRYEAWLLPMGLIFVMLSVFLFLSRESQRHRIEAFLSFAVPFSTVGIILWVLWNVALFRNAFFFATGPFSAQVQAAARHYSIHLHMHPLYSLSIILNVASSMYGIPVLIICLLGLAAYLYMNRHGSLSFGLLTIAMLMAPMLADYAAMIQGSGEIYPVGEKQWFNGRYLIFAAPLIAFGATSLVFFTTKIVRRNMLPTVIVMFVLVLSYSLIFADQRFEVGKTTAMADNVLLPFSVEQQATHETGNQIGKLYDGTGKIVLFTTNEIGQQFMFASEIPLKNFIDVAGGYYWSTSKGAPWVYGEYVVIAKPMPYLHATFDPNLKIIEYWQAHEAVLDKYYRIIYENQYFQIFIRR
jgi:hypothetical protein